MRERKRKEEWVGYEFRESPREKYSYQGVDNDCMGATCKGTFAICIWFTQMAPPTTIYGVLVD